MLPLNKRHGIHSRIINKSEIQSITLNQREIKQCEIQSITLNLEDSMFEKEGEEGDLSLEKSVYLDELELNSDDEVVTAENTAKPILGKFRM
uniref:Uncharacterized protein n=1 Tax=Romanomermis culicivorax TaxID=13658 RepID=A0A915I684_ROMCU